MEGGGEGKGGEGENIFVAEITSLPKDKKNILISFLYQH